MSSEHETSEVDIGNVHGNFGNLRGVERCTWKQVEGANGTYARFALYLEADADPNEVITLAKLTMPGMGGTGEVAWVENDGAGNVIVIGTSGLNPNPSHYPDLRSF